MTYMGENMKRGFVLYHQEWQKYAKESYLKTKPFKIYGEILQFFRNREKSSLYSSRLTSICLPKKEIKEGKLQIKNKKPDYN